VAQPAPQGRQAVVNAGTIGCPAEPHGTAPWQLVPQSIGTLALSELAPGLGLLFCPEQ
jgi:hypothetical protein